MASPSEDSSSDVDRAHASVVPLIEAEQAPILARPFYPREGAVSPLTASLAHVPEVLEVALPFVGRVLGPTSVAARTKEIVVLRCSALMECRYCVETHTALALDSGLSREEVLSLRGEREAASVFCDEAELALIAWVEAVALGRGAAPAEVTARARQAMDAPQLVELTLVAAATLMLNRFCSSLGLATGPAALARLAEEGLR